MNFIVYHEAKSKYAYLYDQDTVHLRLIAQKDKVTKVEVLYGDPFFWGESESNPDVWEWKIETSDSTVMNKEYQTQQFDHFFIAVKPEFKRMKYAFIINNRYLYGANDIIDLEIYPEQRKNLFGYFNFPFLNKEDLFDAPSWIEDQVWYSIFPERFHNGNGRYTEKSDQLLPWGETDKYSNNQRFGGDLEGIIKKLDYLHDLGITGIYMTPIFESFTSHKYDIINYKKIDPAFGTNATFKRLVEKAHSLGIKVTLDAVFNHCSISHPWFIDVIKKGKESIYFDCFHILDKEKPVFDEEIDFSKPVPRELMKKYHDNPRLLNYRTFAFTPYMPKLNTENKLMREHLLDAAVYWVKEYDIDGWRLDVSNEVPHEFWREFRTRIKDIKKDVYIIGENWDNSNPWLQGDQYDAVMNYGTLFPIWNYFGTNIDYKQYKGQEFIEKINKVLTDYPKNVLRAQYNLIDSHDTTRIMEICSNNIDLVKLPYIFMFSLPGAPSIYYGGEVGLSGKHDPDNRRCFPWDQVGNGMNQFMKRLITLRNSYQAFKSTDLKWIEYCDSQEYIIYEKEDLVFILSKSYPDNEIVLPKAYQNQTFLNIFKNEKETLGESIHLTKFGFRIYQK